MLRRNLKLSKTIWTENYLFSQNNKKIIFQSYRGFKNKHDIVNKHSKLTLGDINQGVVNANYAVRGRLAVRADELKAQLKKDPSSLPFKKIVYSNIGNPQQLDQKPITFIRQVLSLLEYPALLNSPDAEKLFFKESLNRARWLHKEIGSVGAYSSSQGVECIRESVAKFITERDNHQSYAKDIFLTSGASSGVSVILNIICAEPKTGIMIPVPQYPLYSASLSILDATSIPYYLTEENNWSTSPKDIINALNSSKALGITPRAIVVINPGNPTGSVLSYDDQVEILRIAAQNNLVVIADEVYQKNIYSDNFQFNSFKKVLRDQQEQFSSKGIFDSVQLVSLQSTSKGMIGECGQRGGYFELVGFNKEIVEQIYKLCSIRLCAAVAGQVIVELMVHPPSKGTDAYESYISEIDGIKQELSKRALALYNAFNKMEGVTCQKPNGAMYLFPNITLPKKCIDEAYLHGLPPDEFYCLRLLEQTGVCVVPGSGFGQRANTLHFRTTFLAPGTEYADAIYNFHQKFMEEFA